ncbi:hypothetical protein SAMN06264364_11143 [Quadrisphaera granulorum]|uniref:Uncharacterized protein n=1 Tax=Quadrisphaera granulorum TaxID=317664 RepID=A0A316A9G5_9ACTN|nr:hypothetical protein BXY45_11143 [Quadrisphaera granulorum]SZE96684.1 hypothetical protein SAMN06264364_11143 [Quadrisphaera granulorum]
MAARRLVAGARPGVVTTADVVSFTEVNEYLMRRAA